MEYLEGGRSNQIARIGGKVHRPAGEWTPYIHEFLNHIRSQGFLGTPEPIGFDAEGNEIVSFISGEVSNYPLSKAAASVEALISAAQLLRFYHDASVSFLDKLKGNEPWLLPTREPVEVICHGDYAPYNVVLDYKRAVAIIDFDTAHPGPRSWDIAYALYRWAPLTNPDNPDGFGSELEKIDRCRLFCDVYGLSERSRSGLISTMVERLQLLVAFMRSKADSGDETFRANIADGHHIAYLADIEYLKANAVGLQAGLSTGNGAYPYGSI
ncbi:aminoglycoside phosphotransferase family protein [Chloroflexota bacterium]